jgi:hypothetical protein
MPDQAFPYRLRVNLLNRYSIIRFPNEAEIYRTLTAFSHEIPITEFYSLTRTAKEISVIQSAKYPTYPQELGESLHGKIQVEAGFVLIEVIPMTSSKIDFGIVIADDIDDSHDGTVGPIS